MASVNEKPVKFLTTTADKLAKAREVTSTKKEWQELYKQLSVYEDILAKQNKLAELSLKGIAAGTKEFDELTLAIKDTKAAYDINEEVTTKNTEALRDAYKQVSQKINIITMPLAAWRSTMLKQVLRIEENKTRLLFKTLGKTYLRSAQARTGFSQIFAPLRSIFGSLFSDFMPLIDGLTNTLKGFGNVFVGSYKFIKGFFSLDDKYDKGMHKMEELQERFAAEGKKLLDGDKSWNEKLLEIKEKANTLNISQERGFFRNRSKRERWIQKETLKAMENQKAAWDRGVVDDTIKSDATEENTSATIDNTISLNNLARLSNSGNMHYGLTGIGSRDNSDEDNDTNEFLGIKRFATGGKVGQTGLALVHKGERVLAKKETDSFDSGRTIVESIKQGITQSASAITDPITKSDKGIAKDAYKRSLRTTEKKETSWWDKLLSWLPLALAAFTGFKGSIMKTIAGLIPGGGMLSTAARVLGGGYIASKMGGRRGGVDNTGPIVLGDGSSGKTTGGASGKPSKWGRFAKMAGKGALKGGLIGGAIGLGSALISGDPMSAAIGSTIGGVAGGVLGGMIPVIGPFVAPFTAMAGSALGEFLGKKGGDIFESAMDPGREKLMEKIGHIESKNKDNAQNPYSSAGGRYQFIDETWRKYAREAGVNEDPSGKYDESTAKQVMRAALKDYETKLSAAGCPVNDTTLYMCHFLGVNGAIKVLQNGQASVSDFIGSSAFAANPGNSMLAGTGQDMYNDITERLRVGGEQLKNTPKASHGAMIGRTGNVIAHTGEAIVPKESVDEWKKLLNNPKASSSTPAIIANEKANLITEMTNRIKGDTTQTPNKTGSMNVTTAVNAPTTIASNENRKENQQWDYDKVFGHMMILAHTG